MQNWEPPAEVQKKMLTDDESGYTFVSANLKDRLHRAIARLSVNSSIDYWAPARHLMRSPCVAFALRLGSERDARSPDGAILIR